MSERSTFWLSHLSAIEAEGITTKAYAEREGLSPQALYQWRKRLVAGGRRSRAKLGGFVPIQIEPSVTARASCTVVIDAQLRLECATLPGVDWLAALSAALSERGR
ncbi:MAG: transposase [Thauera sp.]|jgi:transposase|uniref:IS66 family insertion sequence element accessory protein TnpA n=1 Tax=Amaricoccus sp. TaxID=1872485 RepID=UPI001B6F569B|nr:transposase [Thauera sp.]